MNGGGVRTDLGRSYQTEPCRVGEAVDCRLKLFRRWLEVAFDRAKGGAVQLISRRTQPRPPASAP